MADEPVSRLRLFLESAAPELARRTPPGTEKRMDWHIRRTLRSTGVENLEDDVGEVWAQFFAKMAGRFSNRGAADIRGAGWLWVTLQSTLSDFSEDADGGWPKHLRANVDTRDAVSMERLLDGRERVDLVEVGGDEQVLQALFVFYLGKLSPREGEVLLYSCVRRYTTARIAEEMGIQVNSAVSLLSQALCKLKRLLLDAIEKTRT